MHGWRGPPGVYESAALPRLFVPAAELLLDALPPLTPQTRVLEVGAASGALSRPLVERIAGLGRLIAAEVDDAFAWSLPDVARRAARVVAGFPRLPFHTGAFDLACLNLILGHDDDDDASALRELRRLVRPDGSLLFTSLLQGSLDTLLELLEEIADARADDDVLDAVRLAGQRLPSPEALAARVEGAGFSIQRSGVEERLLGVYDGRTLLDDVLLQQALLPTLLASVPLTTPLRHSLATAVDTWHEGRLTVRLHTGVWLATRRS